MFTKKHKDLINQIKQYSDLCHEGFDIYFTQPSYPFFIKDLNFSGSQLYLGENFILIELFWRHQLHIGKYEIYKLIYSILDIIAYECDTEFSRDLNPDVNIKGIIINNSSIDLKSLVFETREDNVYIIQINYEDLNKMLIRDELKMYEIEVELLFNKNI